jgi:2'-5' RNA ligase
MSSEITIGIAVAIPDPHSAVLAGWRRRIGDPQADCIPPHVTLLPPTEFAIDQLEMVGKHLEHAAARVAPFTMRLSGTGTFRPVSQVVFVQVSAGIGQCEVLENAVRRPPILRELDFPYHPHVTIAHDVAPQCLDDAMDGLRDFVAQFVVDRFVMYSQDGDGVWRVVREFLLTGP